MEDPLGLKDYFKKLEAKGKLKKGKKELNEE